MPSMNICSHKGLVTNYGEGGGATKREGGACEILPLRKGGGDGTSFSHAERGGGHNKFLCSGLKF